MRLLLAALALAAAAAAAGAAPQRPAPGGTTRRQDVYIAGFFPVADKVRESSLGRGVMPSVRLAVEHINENRTVLRNYRLHMWWNDTQVSLRRTYTFYIQLALRHCKYRVCNSDATKVKSLIQKNMSPIFHLMPDIVLLCKK